MKTEQFFTELTDHGLNWALQTAVGDEGIRVNTKIAKKLLQENKTIKTNAGHIYHLRIKNLGMGVYKIMKAAPEATETVMVK
jgi:hypothetical protein